MQSDMRQLLQLFAQVLDYPGDDLLAAARECQALLVTWHPGAAHEMRAFVAVVERESRESLQEIYTRTFDVTPTTNLYVGYHLFGESFKRGAFLARLQEAFSAHHFSCGAELPDHLCVLLRFAGAVHDPEFVDPLLEDGILPALDKIESAFQESAQGYAPAIRALRLFLQIALGPSPDEELGYREGNHREDRGDRPMLGPGHSFCRSDPEPLATESRPRRQRRISESDGGDSSPSPPLGLTDDSRHDGPLANIDDADASPSCNTKGVAL